MFGFEFIIKKNELNQLSDNKSLFYKNKDFVVDKSNPASCQQEFEFKTVIIGLHGVLLNQTKITQAYATNNLAEVYTKVGLNFFLNLLDGEYSGYILDTNTNQLVLFTNPTGTKKLFYFFTPNTFIASPSTTNITKQAREMQINYTLDFFAAMQMLAYHNTLENHTLIKEVRKLLGGEYLKIDLNQLKVTKDKYFNYEFIAVKNSSYNQLIADFDEVFSQAVAQSLEYDTNRNKKPLFLLSGGLDSRANLFKALQVSNKKYDVLCFSEPNYFDHTISQKIAKELGLNYNFVSLQGGDFLNNIESLASVASYTIKAIAAIHYDFALQSFFVNNTNDGLIQSGQIGDGVLGGFNHVADLEPPSWRYKMIQNNLIHQQIKSESDKILSSYQNNELFLLQNLAFNKTVLGSYVAENYGYQVSPFMQKEVLNFALSIHPKHKYNHRFYFDWLKTCVPKSINYSWEATLMRPNKKWKKQWGEQLKKRAYVQWHKKITNKLNRTDMAPYSFYFKSNSSIAHAYDLLLDQNINLTDAYPELKKSIVLTYKNGDVQQKAAALTLLLAIKTYF